VFEPNGEPLWAQVRSAVTTFLIGLHRRGAGGSSRRRRSSYAATGRR
jgi:hypothetical protein